MSDKPLTELTFDLVRADKSEKWESYLIRCDRPTHIEYLINYNIELKIYSIMSFDNIALPNAENQSLLFAHLDAVREKIFNGEVDKTINCTIKDSVEGKISHIHYLAPE